MCYGSGVALYGLDNTAPIPADAIPTVPTTQEFTAAGAHVYIPTSSLVKYIWVQAVAAGAGGGAVGASTAPNGTDGGDTVFDGVTAKGGSGGLGNTTAGQMPNGGAGGTGGAGTASRRIAGQDGGNLALSAGNGLPGGGASYLGGAAPVNSLDTPSNGLSAKTNSGSGGGGAQSAGTTQSASAGGGGEYIELYRPFGSYTLTVGAPGPGGIGTGTGARTGGAGAAGRVLVTEYYR